FFNLSNESMGLLLALLLHIIRKYASAQFQKPLIILLKFVLNQMQLCKLYLCKKQALKAIMEVLLFGISKEITGQKILDLSKDNQINTVLDLKKWILKKYPEMGNLNSFAIAVDQEYANDDLQLSDQQEIALIPPVSGG
ncbi:MoaD/ThiS family protein, partial [Cyclobacterium sp.]|uniref:MoaD/ThiS family protein n=1 Tax=Cyclobacterium sp. TaxID=1966343 RepID=UPI0025BA2ED4